MAEQSVTPPGLEALAKHLGYTFVKKDGPPSQASEAKVDGTDPSSENQGTAGKEEQPEPKKSTGSETSFASIYYNDDDDTWTSKEPSDTDPAENEETACHAIILRQKKSTDSRKKFEIHSIVVQSPSLKLALADILKDYPGVFCNLNRLIFKAPFEPFVHRWGAFLEYMEKRDLEDTTKAHMSLLHDVLKKELGDTIKAFEDYVAHGVVTYEHAWIVFQPSAVVLSSSGLTELCAMKLISGGYGETDRGNFYQMHCQRIDWDGKQFGFADQYVDLPEFHGIKPIKDLPVFPLAFHPRKEGVKRSLVERGKRFAALAGYHHKNYDGQAIERTRNGNIMIQIKGRIILDVDSFCKQPDQCEVFVQPFSHSTTSTSGQDTSESRVEDTGDSATSHESSADEVSPHVNGTAPKSVKFTDYQYMLCSPLSRGYSLKAKKWLSFFITHVGLIEWSDQAFDTLVLPAAQKKLILALSKTQAAIGNMFDDMIAGKGKGMILLLSGPPGVGKTLTAEAVSENMRVPLYMMSAGDLGISPDEVEYNLENILEMAAKWKAILLIDECDVFLEARSIHDLERNKLVSIFLRLLEYYRGTLVLTTNRVDNMDPAFGSRIDVHMKYPGLSTKSRRQIWAGFLEKLPCHFEEGELVELAQEELNGRQIKNLVKTAHLLALEDQRSLCKEHIDMVLAIKEGFAEDE